MPNQDPTQDPQNTPPGHSSDDQPVIIPSDSPVIPPVTTLPPAIEPPISQPPTSAPITKDQVPSFLNSTDLPPLAPDFQNVVDDTSVTKNDDGKNAQVTDSGSNAPLPDLPMTTGSPKKKFGGGKIIATILGLFLLIGGIAGGVILTQQNQNLSEKAGGIDYQIDPTNCGQAGNQCAPGKGCVNGSCVTVNTQTDPNNCGSPGFVCATGATCQNGQCGGSQFQTDPNNCGQAGNSCGNFGCQNGQCNNTSNDSNNCGQIGNQCGSGQSCVSGMCTGGGTGGGTCAQTNCYTTLDHTTGAECKNNQYCYTEIRDKICSRPAGKTCNECGWNGASSAENTIAPAGPKCIVEFIPVQRCEPKDCDDTTPTPPPGTPTAQCQNIKAYSTTWALLTNAQLAALTPTTVVNFCVLGTASEGTFDRAKLTINTVAQSETTTKRPTTNDYCQSYTIPAGVTSFNITAQIHHVTLGWK